MMPRLALVVLSLFGMLLAEATRGSRIEGAQDKAQQTPLFRSESELVTVDVVVVDKHGDPVRDLAAADFTIAEEGRPQTVQFFQTVATTGEAPFSMMCT